MEIGPPQVKAPVAKVPVCRLEVCGLVRYLRALANSAMGRDTDRSTRARMTNGQGWLTMAGSTYHAPHRMLARKSGMHLNTPDVRSEEGGE